MNAKRRKALEKVIGKINEAKDELVALKEEEEESRDNTPEGLQGSERYEKTEYACEALEEAVGLIEGGVSMIEEAIE